MSYIIPLIAVALYSLASALLTRSLAHQAPRFDQMIMSGGPNSPDSTHGAAARGGRRRKTLLLAAVAALLHGWLVYRQAGLPGALSLPLLTAIAATTLTIVLLHILLCLRQPADYLGIAVYPLAAISLISSHASAGGTPIEGSAVQIHVFLSLVSYAMLALAAAQAVLVAIQIRFLSRHKPGGFMRALPPLDSTEELLFILFSTGFVLLTLSLASGFFFLEDMFAQHLVHKTVLSCIAWGIFGILLFGRWQFGWRGKKAVHWTLAGFATLVLAYFGSKVVLEVVLQ
ncbi:cytochrome C assembly family protein [Granulosicoccus sp. 3-233]|uniref:cytochrome C assembly family protein n=1 Tax=Granulosicoccus sp. 3-233 TaxID=3417969 RepID=UPI003D34C4F4